MNISYDQRYNIAYLRLAEKKKNVNSIKIGEEIIIDIGKDGTLYGLEFLNANKQLFSDKSGVDFSVLNEATGNKIQIPMPV
jgi:uncharacterized protein YuzE